ncbi:helix-turn-helix transcriptional regulator [Cedecea sp.]|jgi:DNA-binding CsgD family transcriptional regulator|uniref:helix-turn-helix transcriptional regulator n=1 Tax=Cedecea sp. TaxID=1970739 RepID=UPI002F3F2AC0
MSHIVVLSHCNQTKQGIDLYCKEIFRQKSYSPRLIFIDTRPLKYECDVLSKIIRTDAAYLNYHMILVYRRDDEKLLNDIPAKMKIDIDSSLVIWKENLIRMAADKMLTRDLIAQVQQKTSVNRLTFRESEVYQHMRQGRSAKSISETLSVNVKTVYSHQYSIVKKMNIPSIKMLYQYATHR